MAEFTTVRRYSHCITRLRDDSRALLALAGSPATAKYIPKSGRHKTVYTRWTEALRYHARGEVSARRSHTWLTEATRVHNAIITEMRLDGWITP
jgi:hypothetical protein